MDRYITNIRRCILQTFEMMCPICGVVKDTPMSIARHMALMPAKLSSQHCEYIEKVTGMKYGLFLHKEGHIRMLADLLEERESRRA